jgi:hypothetical protein
LWSNHYFEGQKLKILEGFTKVLTLTGLEALSEFFYIHSAENLAPPLTDLFGFDI